MSFNSDYAGLVFPSPSAPPSYMSNITTDSPDAYPNLNSLQPYDIERRVNEIYQKISNDIALIETSFPSMVNESSSIELLHQKENNAKTGICSALFILSFRIVKFVKFTFILLALLSFTASYTAMLRYHSNFFMVMAMSSIAAVPILNGMCDIIKYCLQRGMQSWQKRWFSYSIDNETKNKITQLKQWINWKDMAAAEKHIQDTREELKKLNIACSHEKVVKIDRALQKLQEFALYHAQLNNQPMPLFEAYS